MSYDTKCRDLAAAFLSDEPMLDYPHHHDALAQRIQDCIEDYIEEHAETIDLMQKLRASIAATAKRCPHCGKPDDGFHAYGTRGYACDARPARG